MGRRIVRRYRWWDGGSSKPAARRLGGGFRTVCFAVRLDESCRSKRAFCLLPYPLRHANMSLMAHARLPLKASSRSLAMLHYPTRGGVTTSTRSTMSSEVVLARLMKGSRYDGAIRDLHAHRWGIRRRQDNWNCALGGVIHQIVTSCVVLCLMLAEVLVRPYLTGYLRSFQSTAPTEKRRKIVCSSFSIECRGALITTTTVEPCPRQIIRLQLGRLLPVVIPAKAGIQSRYPRAGTATSACLDSRLRGNDR